MFMPKLHLKQSKFRNCGLLAKHRKRIHKFKETRGLNYICFSKIELMKLHKIHNIMDIIKD